MTGANGSDAIAPLENILAMAFGDSVHQGSHRCAHDGRHVWCWGSNDFGQLGQGHTVGLDLATPVTGLVGSVTGLAAGNLHTCAIVSDRLYCWGRNSESQTGQSVSPGDPETHRVLQPTEVAELHGEIIDLALDSSRSCAALDDKVFCWGRGAGASGVLHNSPTPSLSWQTPGAITSLPEESCALVGDIAYCIDDKHRGGQASPRLAHQLLGVPLIDPDQPSQPRLILGADDGCAIFAGNDLRCWGLRAVDMDESTSRSSATKVPLPQSADIYDLAIGGRHLCASTSGGLYCWGDNTSGQFGLAAPAASAEPVLSQLEAQPQDRVIAGLGYTCLWRPGTDQALRCWGQALPGLDGYAALGDRQAHQPFEVPVPGVVKQLEAGRRHFCGLIEGDGVSVHCWGDIKTDADYPATPSPERYRPRRVLTGLTDIQRISGSAFTACAHSPQSDVCWGMDYAIAGPTRGRRVSPTPVNRPATLEGAAQTNALSVGGRHMCIADPQRPLQCIGLQGPACDYLAGIGSIGPGGGYAACSENEFSLPEEQFGWMGVAGLPASPAAVLESGDQFSCAVHGPRIYCWGQGNGVPFDVSGSDEQQQGRQVRRQGSLEPQGRVPIEHDPSQPCPAFMIAGTSLLDPLDSDASGAWATQTLLREGRTRLHGGLNFGGFANASQRVPGFAAFRIDNEAEQSQRVRLEMQGEGDQFKLEIESWLPGSDVRERVTSIEVDLLSDESTTLELELAHGFHVVRLTQLDDTSEPALFLVSARTKNLDGSAASFRYGAVVGGYIEPGLTGFSAICAGAAGEIEVRTEGRQGSRGPKGAGDLRLRLENRSTGQIVYDSLQNGP